MLPIHPVAEPERGSLQLQLAMIGLVWLSSSLARPWLTWTSSPQMIGATS
jgi:hypothetical protein